MEPSEDWLGSCKSQPAKETPCIGNVAQSWQWRERGMNPPGGTSTRAVLEQVAEDRLVHKGQLNIKCCDLPGYPRSTFLMIFSPDGTTVASTHGNHNIYLTELSNGKHVRILRGHPRTPWCIAFHPSHAELVGSGCLGGQVRVWDSSGGSEVWTVENETVIASIAFHPRDQLLVVATYNELYFWDWSQPQPFTKVCTNNVNEKVRYVAFDALGYKLITGISVWPAGGCGGGGLPTAAGGGAGGAPGASPPPPLPPHAPHAPRSPGGGPARAADGAAQELIVTSYHNLVQRYDSLVRNYHRLFLSRAQPTNTTDRGTDPMEVDSGGARLGPSRLSVLNGNPLIGGAERDSPEMGEPASPSSRLLNLDVLTLDNAGPGSASTDRAQDSTSREEPNSLSRELHDSHMIFDPRTSAFQRLLSGDPYNVAEHQRRIFRRILPNPFSSSSLSQTDLRHRISNRRASISRTRPFPANSTNATSAEREHSRNSSSRTRGFMSLRRDEPSGDSETAAQRPLPSEPQIEPQVNDDTVLRRRALERLLELEQITPEEPTPDAAEEFPTGSRTLEEMLFGLDNMEYPRTPLHLIPLPVGSPPTTTQPPPTTPPRTIPPPPMVPLESRYNLFEPQAQSSTPQRDIGLRALLNFSTPPLNDPPIASRPLEGINYFTPQLLGEESEINERMSIEYLESLRQSTNRREAPPGANTRPASETLPVSTSEHTAGNSNAPPSSTTETRPRPNSELSPSITQSLDIIRDILRDSGNRLLNLITDMSLSTLAGVGDAPESEQSERTPDDDMYTLFRTRTGGRGRQPVLPSASASDSDSDRSVEVNIYRTRNATIPDNSSPSADNTESTHIPRPTSRMVVNLDLGGTNGGPTSERGSIRRTLNNNRINITVSNNRFRLRTNNVNESPIPERRPEEVAHNTERRSEDNTQTRSENEQTPADVMEHQRRRTDSPRPSTSRDADWLYNSMGLPPGERRSEPLSAADALRKVKLGIAALQQHTTRLTDMWLRGERVSMRDIRLMWEDLRRQVVALQRQTARNDTPSYFARSILERCNMLNDLSRRLGRNPDARDPNRRDLSAATTETAIQTNVSPGAEGQSGMDVEAGSDAPNPAQPSTSESGDSPAPPRTSPWARNKRSAPTAGRTTLKARATPSARRRLQTTGHRWRPVDEQRRRQRIAQRMEQYIQGSRNSSRMRLRDNVRHIELHFTRHEIRLRAMQVLSIMFNMMMACLEEGELSSQIILMLRNLKKALGVTCLLLMTNRSARRDSTSSQNLRRRNSAGASTGNPRNEADSIAGRLSSQATNRTASSNEEAEPTSMRSTENAQHSSAVGMGHVSVPMASNDSAQRTSNHVFAPQSHENSHTSSSNNRSVSERYRRLNDIVERFRQRRVQAGASNSESFNNPPSNKVNKSTSTLAQTVDPNLLNLNSSIGNLGGPNVESEPSTTQRWSNRLAVQISAANNNQSETAKGRKDMYLERKRQKALHRYNPIAHPLAKRKTAPPLTSHRIPTPRVAPPRRVPARPPPRDCFTDSRRNSLGENAPDELAAGTSDPQPSTSADRAPDGTTRSRQEYRAGLLRFAQFHAARLRNATRNRYRIRLYTPSSVREMFDILTTNGNEREPESPLTLNNAPENRRSFSTYRPRLLPIRNNLGVNQSPEGNRPFGSILNNVPVPLVHVNNMPVNDPQGGGDAPPRVNEYLQPIILAQNALVVEEAGGGGLLEAGLISESLAVPVHRVQAWDFTRRAAPDIKDSTKNVVVQRCKIHNDASIDISRDGRLLVALLPVHRMRNMSHRLGVYSLEWGRLGQCLHTAVLEQSAVSVALSPTARHLAVGLGSRRVTTLPHNRNNVFALLFRLSDEGPVNENSRQCGLIPVRILDHNWEHGFTSLNCLRWAPAPGQGLLYANNTGQLIIMS